jgi:deoxyribonuclease-4
MRVGGEPTRKFTSVRAAREKHGLTQVVIHDNYLINLAASDPVIREKSIAAFRKEIERALGLGADFLVTHPGSAKGGPVAEAIETCAASLKESARGLVRRPDDPDSRTRRAGSAIGRTFEEVAEIIAGARICPWRIDTAQLRRISIHMPMAFRPPKIWMRRLESPAGDPR